MPPVTVSAYVEVYYQRNLDEPDNHVTNARGFDQRSDAFTLSNVALGLAGVHERFEGLVTLQYGPTGEAYYSTADADWKNIQQAYGGYRFPVGEGLLVQAGLFLSPIGPESIAIKDDWNWSRSDLFYALPFYHAGLRVSQSLRHGDSVSFAIYNGWNDIDDNNTQKSVSVQYLGGRDPSLIWSALYFGGVERPTGSPEGEPWRNLFDAHVTWSPPGRFALIAHADAGFEDTTFGTDSWWGAALAGRARVAKSLFVALRGDVFDETVPSDAAGTATPIFFPVSRVASATLTLDLRPDDHISFRFEARHDRASGDLYYGGAASVPNRDRQTTLTLGVVAGF